MAIVEAAISLKNASVPATMTGQDLWFDGSKITDPSFWAQASAASKIRVLEATTGKILPCYIENFVANTGFSLWFGDKVSAGKTYKVQASSDFSYTNTKEHVFIGSNNLIRYGFEEASGNIIDCCKNYDGTASNLTYAQAGKVGKSCVFNGNNSNVALGDIPISGLAKLTIQVLFKQNTLDAFDYIFRRNKASFDANNRIEIYPYTDGRVYIAVCNSGNTYAYWDYSQNISQGEWYLFTFVFDGTQSTNANRLKIYVNATPITLEFGGGNMPTTTANMSGGNCYIGSTTDSLSGSVCDFRILPNYAMSANEITWKYNNLMLNDVWDISMSATAQTPATYSSYTDLVKSLNPIQHLPIDEVLGATDAQDSTTNNRDGAYTAVALNKIGINPQEKSGYFDGTSSVLDAFSAGLASAFDFDEGSILLWAKPDASVWGGADRNILQIKTDANNLLSIGLVSGNVVWSYKSAGTAVTVSVAASDTQFEYNWMPFVITWSKSAGRLRAYVFGTRTGARAAIAEQWVGSITEAAVGGITGAFWKGYLSHFAIWDSELSKENIATLADSYRAYSITGFGDSITAGHEATSAANRYLNRLAVLKSCKVINNAGIDGTILQNTIQNTVSTIGAASDNNGRDTYLTRLEAHESDYVVIYYGVNDMLLNDAAITTANYEHDFIEILSDLIARGYVGSNIYILNIGYLSGYSLGGAYTAGSPEKHVAYNAAILRVAKLFLCRFADIYSAMVAGGEGALLADPVHPNDAGMELIANTVAAAEVVSNPVQSGAVLTPSGAVSLMI